MRCPTRQVCLSHRPERHLHPSGDLGRSRPEVPWPKCDILGHRRHEELVVGILKDEADPAADLVDRLGSQFHPTHPDRARGRGQDPVEVEGESGLAGAVGPE